MQTECRFVDIVDFQEKSSAFLVYHECMSLFDTLFAKGAHPRVQPVWRCMDLLGATFCHSRCYAIQKVKKPVGELPQSFP